MDSWVLKTHKTHLSKEESKMMRFLDEVTLHASIERSSYVAMVAKFLDGNKPKRALKKWTRTVSNFVALWCVAIEVSLEGSIFTEVVAYQFINLNGKLNASRKEDMHRSISNENDQSSRLKLPIVVIRNFATMVTWRHTSLHWLG